MCRGSVTASSTNTVGSPNAPSASRIAASTEGRSVSGGSTRRIPRPPPPATALTKTGNVRLPVVAAQISSTSRDGAMLRRTGTPAALAAATALDLLPVSRSTSLVGPMNVMPASTQAWARAGFSDRKP